MPLFCCHGFFCEELNEDVRRVSPGWEVFVVVSEVLLGDMSRVLMRCLVTSNVLEGCIVYSESIKERVTMGVVCWR